MHVTQLLVYNEMLVYLEKTYLLESSNSHFKETGLELRYPISRAWNLGWGKMFIQVPP